MIKLDLGDAAYIDKLLSSLARECEHPLVALHCLLLPDITELSIPAHCVEGELMQRALQLSRSSKRRPLLFNLKTAFLDFQAYFRHEDHALKVLNDFAELPFMRMLRCSHLTFKGSYEPSYNNIRCKPNFAHVTSFELHQCDVPERLVLQFLSTASGLRNFLLTYGSYHSSWAVHPIQVIDMLLAVAEDGLETLQLTGYGIIPVYRCGYLRRTRAETPLPPPPPPRRSGLHNFQALRAVSIDIDILFPDLDSGSLCLKNELPMSVREVTVRLKGRSYESYIPEVAKVYKELEAGGTGLQRTAGSGTLTVENLPAGAIEGIYRTVASEEDMKAIGMRLIVAEGSRMTGL